MTMSECFFAKCDEKGRLPGHSIGGALRRRTRGLRPDRFRTRWPTRSRANGLLLLLGGLFAGDGAAAVAQDRDNCLYCHRFPGLSRMDSESQRVRLLYVDPAYVAHGLGPHASLACTDCHPREEVDVVPHREVTRVDCARQCHLTRPDAPPRVFSHASVARLLEQSVHDPRTLHGARLSGGPLLSEGQSFCLYCHDEPVFSSSFRRAHLAEPNTDRCDVCHTTGLPLDTRRFLQHVVARLQPARPVLELAQVCAICHSDPVFREARGGDDPVASYVRSFHGKAALLGDETTANCLDCHVRRALNVHVMLGPDDPASAVHPAHLADSCRSTRCHPGADPRIAATAVHLDLPSSRGTLDYLIAAAFIVLTIVSFGPSALIVLLELLQLVLARHPRGHEPIRRLTEALDSRPGGRERLRRFTPGQRVQHWVLTLLFVLLVLTGFPMKFADTRWAAVTIHLFGGLSHARAVHHAAGVALLVGFSVHCLIVLRGVLHRAAATGADGRARGMLGALWSLPLMLRGVDLRRTAQLLTYLVGRGKRRPSFGRFTATEKFEYLGVLWGTTLLGLTGILLWAEQFTSHVFGGRVFNIASIVHTYEAFLALIHVGILHMYNVILAPAVFPLSLAMLTGRTPRAKLVEEHGEFVVQAGRELGLPTQEAQAALGAGDG
jgi:cytochrome b subunit of formate dehydrogenase